MSHFTVLVITRKRANEDDLEKILAPYYEQLENMPPQIRETKEQYLKKERKNLEIYKNTRYAEYLKDKKAYEENCKNNPSHLEYIKNFMKEYNKTDEELLKERDNEYKHWNSENLEYGESFLDKDGNEIVFYNLNGKWDWYTIGGRWNGTLPIISTEDNEAAGGDSNCAQIKNVDFGTGIDIEKLKEDPELKEKYEKLISEGDGFYIASYFASIWPTIEEYIIDTKKFNTFAVVDQNGIWHEKGQMGFFACSSETPEEAIQWNKEYYNNFIKDINPEWWVTLVDCHI